MLSHLKITKFLYPSSHTRLGSEGPKPEWRAQLLFTWRRGMCPKMSYLGFALQNSFVPNKPKIAL